MKTFILFISFMTLLLVNCKKDTMNTVKPIVITPVKNSKIINTYKHPYYKRYIKYHDNLNSLYINHQNKENQQGC